MDAFRARSTRGIRLGATPGGPGTNSQPVGYTEQAVQDVALHAGVRGGLHSKIRLGTGICLVPEHNRLVLPKTAATVDSLSGAGRFIFGVSVGWLTEEFQALGISFDRRTQCTRDYSEVMRKPWTQRSRSHQGEFVNFANVLSYANPISEKGAPLLRRLRRRRDRPADFSIKSTKVQSFDEQSTPHTVTARRDWGSKHSLPA
jgi:Luciferase-like monooxygenase